MLFRNNIQQAINVVFFKQASSAWVGEDLVCHVLFKNLAVVNALFYSLFTDESVDTNVSFLSDSQCPLCCLNINHRVPIRVKNNYFISCGEIYAKTSHTCR